ncbi:MAG: helix-turn-helix domain-containing protein [Thermoanaerobaculales bacterium]|nr:helix-turn-helix domain-containing protein [Thermoanaerobaculales bacterium]
MPNVATVLREETTRLARKEIRQQVEPLKKTISELRRTVASLKADVAELRRSQRFLEKQEKRRLESPPETNAAKSIRFSPKWVKADRKRLGLSAKDYACLVGVSGLTIYNWETGKSKPNAERLAAWAEVRGIGKREAQRRLELLSGATG